MTLIRRLVDGVRALVHRNREEQELDEELRAYLETAAEERMSAGMRREDAMRAARVDFGSVEATKEAVRDVRWASVVDALVHDVRQSFRRLRSHPKTTFAAVGMLGVGIGITTAMFATVDALLFRPVPFPHADRLVQIYMGNEHGGRIAVAPAVMRAWQDSGVFEAVEGVETATSLVESGSGLLERPTAFVTRGVFEMLGAHALRGRLFDEDERRSGTSDRVVISEDLWRSAFHAEASVIGRQIVVNRQPLVVIGILPADFRFPTATTELWRPIDYDRPPPGALGRPMVFVRLAAGIPAADAFRAATQLAHAADGSTAQLWVRTTPLAGARPDAYSARAVPLLAVGVVLVFLVLCANVSTLLLERFTVRRREFAMCSALGASRSRLFRQALAESAVLGTLGAAAGVLIAYTLVGFARSVVPPDFLLQTLNPLNVDLRAIAAAALCGFLGTAVAGLLPAWIGTRPSSTDSLRVIERGGTETRGARSLTRALIVGEIALACSLLAGATLLVRSFVNLAQSDRGLDSHGVVTAWIEYNAELRDSDSRRATAAALEQGVRELPGVASVALSHGLPPAGGGVSFGDWIPDTAGAAPVDMEVDRYHVGADFFDLYGISLVAGRGFVPGDSEDRVIIGRRLAGKLWPGQSAVGRTFRFGRERFEVIGVAAEINRPSIDSTLDRPEFYQPFAAGDGQVWMSIRCRSACPDVALVRQRLAAVSAAVRVVDVAELDGVYSDDLATPRAAAAMGLAFAAVAILAAASGLFTVLSYAVARRRREFGIRTALGGSPAQIRALILRDGFTVTLAGVALGSMVGWWLARALSSLQYGVTVADPVTWSTVLGVLGVTALAACWRPAHEATHVDPVLLLREE
jgi:putative ABC transport system permease protein